MATSRLAKFILEVAPPQYITVMRHRASKMMDTINEEERDVSPGKSLVSSSGSSASSANSSAAATAAAAAAASNSKYFPKGVQRSFSIFEN